MGCFPACFGPWKHKQTIKKVQDLQSLSPINELLNEAVTLVAATTESLKEKEIVNPIKPVSKSDEDNKSEEEQINCSTCINEKTAAGSNGDNMVVENENGKVGEKDLNLPNGIQYLANQDLLIISNKECLGHDVKSKEISLDDKSNKEGCIGDCCFVEEESSESLFSLSIDSRKQVCGAEMGDKEVSSPLKPSSMTKYDDENNKENVNSVEKWPTSDDELNNEFVAVDTTSLSSWLNVSEKSLQKKTSICNSTESETNSGGDRWILAAITLNESSCCLSGGSTPSCSGDGQPAIGTVGRYWVANRRGLVL